MPVISLFVGFIELCRQLRADEASQQHVGGVLPLHGHIANPVFAGVWWFPVTTLLFSVTPGGSNEATPTFVSFGNDETEQSAGFPVWNPAGFSALP